MFSTRKYKAGGKPNVRWLWEELGGSGTWLYQLTSGERKGRRMWLCIAINIVAAAAIAHLWIESFVFSAVSNCAGTCGDWKDNYL